MAELTAVRHIIRTEQDTDITVEFWVAASAGSPWPSGNTMGGQIPPQVITHAIFGIDLAVNRFLADSWLCTFMHYPVTDLLRRPAVFDPFNHTLA
jgi:hypothetical protein